MPERPYTIVLADDHVLIRQALKGLIDSLPGLKVVGEADNGLELLELLKTVIPDLIIIDIFMPYLSGIATIEQIKQLKATSKILILTMSKSIEHIKSGLDAGVEGYLLKDNASVDLLAAIKVIRQGKKYLSPSLLGARMAGDIKQSPLSHREVAVLKLFAEGYTRKKIAEILCVSHQTVIVHMNNIKQKLAIENDTDLIKYALRTELVSL
jgi:two-component system secretion response regulator SsrB